MRQSNVDTKKNEQKLSRPPKIDKLYGFNNINMLIWNHTPPYAYLEPYPPHPNGSKLKGLQVAMVCTVLKHSTALENVRMKV